MRIAENVAIGNSRCAILYVVVENFIRQSQSFKVIYNQISHYMFDLVTENFPHTLVLADARIITEKRCSSYYRKVDVPIKMPNMKVVLIL